MAVLIYSPTVRAYVSTTNAQGRETTLNISEDLIAGKLTLREKGIHTFGFRLQNAQRKYDGIIKPMDRIVVSMSRMGEPLQVMAGYMNNGPVFSVWPRVLDLSASCTLKKLQFWYWDASSNAAQNMIMSWQNSNLNGSDDPNQRTTQPNAADGGLRDMVIKLLVEVVGWPAQKIHIGAIPDRWFDFATEVGDEILKAGDVGSLIGSLGGGASSGGSSGVGGAGNLPAGTYGGTVLNADQAKNASVIFNVGSSRNLPPRAMQIALGTSMQESRLKNLNYGDRDSVGLFQQRPSQGWGTVEQIMDPQYSAGKFYDALAKVPNWQTLPFTVACQKVQRSGFPDAYAKWEPMARAAVDALIKSAQGSSNAGALASGAGGGGAISSGSASARKFAAVAYNLISSHPPGHIRYRLGGDDPYNAPDPTTLDCSSFVDWAYYHTIGRPLNAKGGRSVARGIGPQCTQFDAEMAKLVKGALLFIGGRGNETHVEVSLGNGMSAGARTDDLPLEKQVSIAKAGRFTHGGLLPGLDYTDAATTPEAAIAVGRALGIKATTSSASEFGEGAVVNVDNQSGGGQTDAFNAFVNVYAWGFIPNPSGDIFAGPRAMMNDDPILPYVSNLLGASMRSWCSAPNGDFMAWFPDYFDIWGIAGRMNVRSIELQDFTVEWWDQQIVTHQYVVGVPHTLFDTRTGATSGNPDAGGQLYWQLTTQGIATMDFPQVFRAIFGQDASDKFVQDYLSRFGGRPNMVSIPSIQQGRPEFFMALYLFMQNWANQFRATVPMTFMPELWPGMLLRLPEFNFQAYITEVTHCQPAGTMVRVPLEPTRDLGTSRWNPTEWRDVPIETLREGDRVISWNHKNGWFSKNGKAVNVITTRPHDGLIIVATVGDTTTKYAPNHHCVVTLGRKLDEGEHVVYLMRRGSQYRVGRCLWAYGNGAAGPIQRARRERADAVWLLSVYQTKAEAALHEALAQVQFGLPRESFVDQEHAAMNLEIFWSKVGDNTLQADACLKAMGLLVDYPLWSTDREPLGRGTRSTKIVTAAANLRSGMKMLRTDASQPLDYVGQSWMPHSEWIPITVGTEWYSGLIYSLSVETDHTYVADGVVTHNSFQFGKGGFFLTDAQVVAPARLTNRTDMFGLLPLGGKTHVEPKETLGEAGSAVLTDRSLSKPLDTARRLS
jgi:cell wall-associated NlpC family hydrolase